MMRNIDKRNVTDLVVILLGVLSLSVAANSTNYPVLSGILQSAGTGLMAAGLVSAMIRRYFTVPDVKMVSVVASERKYFSEQYKQRKYSARQIDIMSIALTNVLAELAGDTSCKMFKRILHQNSRLNLLFLSPLGNFARSKNSDEDVMQLEHSVANCVLLHEKFAALYSNNSTNGLIHDNAVGRFEIRVFDDFPYFTVYRVDDRIILGLYTLARRGFDTAALEIAADNSDLYSQIMDHFTAIWHKPYQPINGVSNVLVKYEYPSPPALNTALVAALLGESWREKVETARKSANQAL